MNGAVYSSTGKKAHPTVSVLLSTYNGEAYIRELIESVLGQEDVNVLLEIRDDGSSDSTINIIRSFDDTRIRLTIGSENLKPARSFLKLLRDSSDSQYYAYCDQDDVWNRDKLKNAINQIEAVAKNGSPTLYMSTYDVVDADLAKEFTFDMHFETPLRLQDTLIYRAPSGCVMVFNRALKQEVVKSNPTTARMHDFWTLLVVEAFHYTIVTDNQPSLLYRQHGDNVVSITPSRKTRLMRLLHSAVKGKNERWCQACEFYECYGNEMPDDTKAVLEKVVKYRLGFRPRLKLAFDPTFKTGSLYVNILFKGSVLLGLF